MYVINKEIDLITEQDLQELIDNEVIEAKTVEYKGELPGNTDSEKKEFLADVSSFANASGGDIIYGINTDKDTGKPLPPEGLCIQNVDQEILRLGNIIQYGVEPKISSIDIKPIELSNSKYAIIIRIPRSWNKPHRISFQDNHRFWIRRSNRKALLDVGELRTMFNLSETLAERIRKFREDRISSIIADESFVRLGENPKIVLHLIPLISFEFEQKHNVTLTRLPTILGRDSDWRYNLDGVITYTYAGGDRYDSYTQLYRNGIIEAVDRRTIGLRDGKLSIPSITYEKNIVNSLRNYLERMKNMVVEMPILLFLSLLSIKGYSIEHEKMLGIFGEIYAAIDRDIILLPEVIIENYDEPAEKILKPCFDIIWNACGLERDFNYDESGNWRG